MNTTLALFSFFTALLFFTAACTSEPEEKSQRLVEVVDSSVVESSTVVTEQSGETYEDSEKKSFIAYKGVKEDQHRTALEIFPSFEKVSELAALAIHLKDSLKYLRNVQEITDPNDLKLIKPFETRAYQAIMTYQKTLQDNPHVYDVPTKLLDLTREVEPQDSSYKVLPKVGKSTLLRHGNFFFLGGAPFITKLSDGGKAVYTDAEGNPMTRFESNETENTNYIFNSLLHFNTGAVKVTLGGPLPGYDIREHEIRGVGFLMHEFVSPIPVYFLTASGLVPAHIVSVDLNLIAQGLGCVSDQPTVTFTCLKYLNEEDILGVYIPYHSEPITHCIIKKYDDARVYTIDLNNDGIPELARVSDTFSGISDDKLVEEIWYVNIDGVWKIIEAGAELDCT